MTIATLRGRKPLLSIVRCTLLLVVAVAVSACHLDMYQQPKNKPLSESDLFANRSSARPLLPNTVARSQSLPDERTTGKVGGTGDYVTENPIPITPEVLARGKERFTIYCSVCHGVKADGKGTVSGLLHPNPPSFFDQRIVDMPNGYYFDVMTNGKGAMFQYRSRIQNPDDRWAIIAYIREVQKTPPQPK